jgi:hypothetical protein
MLDTTHPSFLMAALIAIGSAGIFGLRFIKPLASREYDVIFAIVGLIYAIILGWEGWRLIPLLYFAQVLLVAMSVFFAVETFRLRLQLTDIAKQAGGPVRRGSSGFTRTYRPEDYGPERRTVTARSASGRMRTAATDDSRTLGSRRRTLRAAAGPRASLASSTGSTRRSPRSRPAQPPAVDDRIEGPDDYNRDDYSAPPSPPRRPRRPSPPTRDRGKSPYDESRYGYPPEYPEGSYPDESYSNDSYPNDSYPENGPVEGSRPSRRRPPVDRTEPPARRRPPRMPDDIEEPGARPIASIDVEDYDSEYDDDYNY